MLGQGSPSLDQIVVKKTMRITLNRIQLLSTIPNKNICLNLFIFLITRFVISHLSPPHWHCINEVKQGLKITLSSRVLGGSVISNQDNLEIILTGVDMFMNKIPVVVLAQSPGDVTLQF